VSERPDPHRWLRKLHLFANLTRDELARLAPLVDVHDYRRGEFVFHMGEEAERLYLLVRGSIRISRTTPAGDERLLELYKPGDVFGWLYVSPSDRWTAAAEALSSTTVLVVGQGVFMRLVQASPTLALNFVNDLIEQHRRMLVRVEALAQHEPGPRLLAILINIAEHSGERVGDSYTLSGGPTQGDLARMAGLNRSTVNLLINRHRRAGILGGQRDVIVVHREPAHAFLKTAGLIFS
jgi:CRP-like cAMP-binding protein